MSLFYIFHFAALGFVLYDACYSMYTRQKITLIDIVELILAFIPAINVITAIGLVILKTCEKNHD